MGRIVLFAALAWFTLPAPANIRANEGGSTHPATSPTPGNPKCVPCVKGDGKPNASPNVTNVTFDITEVRPSCSGDDTVTRKASNVKVETTAEDPDGDVLTYNYTISGGRIVGTGKNVLWDLTKAQPGTYSLTAAVDDGCGICGKTETKLIAVAECAERRANLNDRLIWRY